MIRRAAWRAHRALRRLLLPGLTGADRAEMDELIRTRVAADSQRPFGEVRVWTRESADLVVAFARQVAGRAIDRRRGWDWGALAGELGVAVRSLVRMPGYSLGVAATLGLGIGATSTVYSVVDGVMLRPLPYEDPSRLVVVGALAPGSGAVDPETGLQELSMMSMPNYLDFEERARSLDRMAAIEPNRTVIPGEGGAPELVEYARVSPGMLEMLGAEPALGRLFAPGDYGPEASEVVVLSFGAWQRRFGADPAAVGGPATPGGDMIIAGVLSPGFRPPAPLFATGEFPELWLPIQGDPTLEPSWYSRRRGRLYLLGHLADGVSLADARSEAGQIAAELAAVHPGDNLESDGSRVGIGMNDLLAQTVGRTGRGLMLFLGAAGLLLLLAALNAATLLLARSLDRAREFGVRMALGAGRARMVRLLLSEAALLAAAGGIVGIGLAFVGVDAFVRYGPTTIPRLASVTVDSRVAVAAAALTLGTGVLVGLLPAVRLTSVRPWRHLREASRAHTASSHRLRSVLVGGQVTVAVVLLSGAALLFNSFVRLRTVDPGFDPDGLIAVVVETKGGVGWNYQQQWVGWDRLREALSTVPGIESLGMASSVPFQSPRWSPRLLMPGDEPDALREGIAGYAITPGYHETMRSAILAGRDIGPQDGPSDERVALVNEAFVRRHLGGRNPIGMSIRWTAGTEWSPGDEWIPPSEWLDGEPTRIRIVGLVEDIVQATVEEGARPAIYVPYTQARGGPTAVIRTSREPSDILPELRVAAAEYNSRVPLIDFASVHERMAATRRLPRFQALLVGAFALVATLLAAAGLFGSLAHFVSCRQGEMGLRIALGASRLGVLSLVLRQGLRVAAAGLIVGLVVTLLSGRVLRDLLYDVGPNDPRTLLITGAVLMVVATLACLVPARRATSVDPARVLGSD